MKKEKPKNHKMLLHVPKDHMMTINVPDALMDKFEDLLKELAGKDYRVMISFEDKEEDVDRE